MVATTKKPIAWRQVPGQYIWQKADGTVVSIRGSVQQAWFVATVTLSKRDDFGFKQGATSLLSPYYILNTKPVGNEGRISNAKVRATQPWKFGTLNNALAAARTYMGRTLKNKGGKY